MLNKNMSTIDYTEKMKKLAPIPEDMRTFWIRDDLARIEVQMPYCLQCIREQREIVAALDDMAQIIGDRVKIVPDDDLEIAKALNSSAAVLVDAEQVLYSSGKLPISGSSTDGRERREKDYVITTGRDPYEAFVALTVLEKAAEVQILADAIGGVKPLPERVARRLRREYLDKYSKAGRERREQEVSDIDGSDAPNDDFGDGATAETLSENLIAEFNGRRAIVEYGNKLVEKKLVQGTWGNISVKLDDEYMLVTPSGLDYDSIGPGDIVKVNIETLNYEKQQTKPTTEMSLHAEIYRSRPDIRAIVHAHSKYCSVFAACQMPIDVSDEGLAREVSTDVIYVTEYAKSGTDELAKNVADALGPMLYGRKGSIISNHGMVACGEDLEQAMEVAEAMEEAARKQINRRIDNCLR